MDETRRKIMAGLFFAAAGVVAGCSDTGNSTESSSQSTGNENEQSTVRMTAVNSPSTFNSQTTFSDTMNETTYSGGNITGVGSSTKEATTSIETDTQTGNVIGEGQNWSASTTPQFTVTVGDPSHFDRDDKPHSILIWNDDTATRSIRVVLESKNLSKSDNFSRKFQIKSDNYVVVKLARYQSYELKIGVGTQTPESVKKIPENLVDCNTSSTHVAVRGNGSIDAITSSTSMQCEPLQSSSTTTK